ncbi:NADPH-dependent FMN reductase [Alienimonas californiensis]|uniref:NAD(P)H-dependent FMN reductase n=1 Tax=Alienimonas californiensis TaxID=2527989 RepID=A0A517PBR0_9PLAN|nr:NADPH-dependent FMN reductase [Alienimonas californiensis]QDT16817.1 NAD(P)H-dependent FMN reductase [Alienimonas californiensis]
MYLVVSASLSPTSRSRLLAEACAARLTERGETVELLDLRTDPLPMCDGAAAYGHPNAVRAAQLVAEAQAVLFASPVYNYDVNAAAKNLVELTGRAWTGKTVGLLLAAGGHGSYMSALGLANSLMLDFRCLIIPRFVYALGEAFGETDADDPAEWGVTDDEIARRVHQLVDETLRVSRALSAAPTPTAIG